MSPPVRKQQGSLGRLIIVSAFLVILLVPAPAFEWAPTLGPVPKGARVYVEFDQDEYFLGENILLDLVVENAGKTTFKVETGGDYRLAPRELRFHVEAVDEQGRLVPDPDPSEFCFGGLVGLAEIKPGEVWCETIALTRYCQFDKPGVYAICAQHDFGWKATIRNPLPSGEARIVLRMPTSDEAEQIVKVMASLTSDPDRASGFKTRPYEDFTTLAYPVYLPILFPLAKRADERALKGIGRIPAVEATAVLLDLIENGLASCELEAAEELCLRLPAPELSGELDPRYINPQETLQRRLCENGWRDQFADPVRACARKFLKAPDTESVETGAFMIECVGTAEDAEPLITALDDAITATSSKPPKCLHPTGAPEALMRPARMLARRGYEPQNNPATPGAIALYLATIEERPDFRPADWETRYKEWLHHPIAYLRQITLDYIPSPVTEPIRQELYKSLADNNCDVRIAACKAVEKNKISECSPEVHKVLAEANNEWLLSASADALLALGERYALVEALANHLVDSDPHVAHEALRLLAIQVAKNNWGQNDLKSTHWAELRSRWLSFLKGHKSEIARGVRFNPRQLAKLFPGFTFTNEFAPSSGLSE